MVTEDVVLLQWKGGRGKGGGGGGRDGEGRRWMENEQTTSTNRPTSSETRLGREIREDLTNWKASTTPSVLTRSN